MIKHPPLLCLLLLVLASCGDIQRKDEAGKGASAPEPLELDTSTRLKLKDLKVGSTREEVLDALGEPTGRMKLGESETVYYHGAPIEFQGEVVSSLPEDLGKAMEEGYLA